LESKVVGILCRPSTATYRHASGPAKGCRSFEDGLLSLCAAECDILNTIRDTRDI